jgi:hypothetical protein
MFQMMIGAIAMGFLVASIFFLRFWRTTGDRLFLFFAVSFFVLGVNRVALGLFNRGPSDGGHLYWVRFAAFVLILIAILDKNRSERGRTS